MFQATDTFLPFLGPNSTATFPFTGTFTESINHEHYVKSVNQIGDNVVQYRPARGSSQTPTLLDQVFVASMPILPVLLHIQPRSARA